MMFAVDHVAMAVQPLAVLYCSAVLLVCARLRLRARARGEEGERQREEQRDIAIMCELLLGCVAEEWSRQVPRLALHRADPCLGLARTMRPGMTSSCSKASTVSM